MKDSVTHPKADESILGDSRPRILKGSQLQTHRRRSSCTFPFGRTGGATGHRAEQPPCTRVTNTDRPGILKYLQYSLLERNFHLSKHSVDKFTHAHTDSFTVPAPEQPWVACHWGSKTLSVSFFSLHFTHFLFLYKKTSPVFSHFLESSHVWIDTT